MDRSAHPRHVEPLLGIGTGAGVAVRDDWATALAWVRADRWRAVELTAITGQLFDSLLPYLEHEDAVADFERVSVHAPVVFSTDGEVVVAQLATLPDVVDAIVVHPWTLPHAALVALGGSVVVENMDVGKSDGKTPEQLERVFEELPDAGFCLDVAHVWTVDRTMALGHRLLDAFGSRLRQLHVSGIEPDGRHRTTTRADMDAYAPVLDRARHVPWIFEAELEPSLR